MVGAGAVSADGGGWVGEIGDGSDRGVLHFLGGRFSRTAARLALGANWASHRGDLSDLGCRERSRRVALVVYDTAGSFCEPGAQNRHARVRGRHRSPRVRVLSDWVLASGGCDRPCCRGASRLFFESFVSAL